MPPSSVSEIVVDNIVTSVNAVIPLLDELHDGLCPPFVQAISNTAVSLISTLQNVKRNKEECCQLMENIHGIIYAIVNAHLQSDPPGCLPPAMLERVGNFTETLHKIWTFVQAQQENSKIKYFFRQNQMSALLKDCRAGLQMALHNFTIISQAALSHDINELQKKTRQMHAEVLELISNLSDSMISDRASSIQTLNQSQASSQSFSLLPSKPQIFHGRESELTQIVQLLNQQCAKIAILGPGGIGKTSLARAALHHPDVAAKYEDRLFVSCESATTSVEIAGFIGAHLGLKPGKDLTKSVLRSLAKKPICLLVLDNLETTWEPLKSRGGTENLLSNLTDIPHLALMVTMRGAEHPAKVRWTRPFLPALAPLSAEAAHEMFKQIAEDYHEPKDIDQLLKFADNMPLAVDLMAHLVAYEGCSLVLTRPRLTAQNGAIDLLRLLSILPDGLSDVELIQSNLVIPQIRTCKSVLLALLPPEDHQLAVEFIVEALFAKNHGIIVNDCEHMASEGKVQCQTLNDPALEAEFYRALGTYYCWHTNNHTEGVQCFDRALILARDTGNMEEQGINLINLALVNWRIGKYTTSQVLANKAYILTQLCGNCYQHAYVLRVQALLAQSLGNFKHSLSLLQTATELLGLCGMSGVVLDLEIRVSIANTHLEKSEYAEARSLFTQLAAEMSVEQEHLELGIALLNMAQIGVVTGASKGDVLQALEKTKKVFSNIDLSGFSTALSEMTLANLELREEDMFAAKNHFEKYLQWSVKARDAQASFYCLERMADVSCWGPANFEWAATFCIIYLAFSKKMKQKLGQYKALCSLGNMFLWTGDELTATSLFTVALDAFTVMDVHHWRANCMLGLGNIALTQGVMAGAEKHWRDAQPLFERSLQAKDIAEIDSRLASIENAHEEALTTLAELQAPTQSLTEFPSSQEQPVKVALA
ncbi:hypothetical protein C8R45DRAFT_1174210 [Mycena sanguinolenta]|nr:hypothetical protein C8R45DRAFT_1174210 [Mycena sanguinolenta]